MRLNKPRAHPETNRRTTYGMWQVNLSPERLPAREGRPCSSAFGRSAARSFLRRPASSCQPSTDHLGITSRCFRQKLQSKREGGFTLVEVLVSTAIFSFLLLSLYGIMQTGTSVYFLDTALLELQQHTRNGMERIIREVRESKVSAVMFIDPDSDKIFFSTPSKNHIMYYRDGTNLLREYSGRTWIIATDIVHLKFIKVGTQLTIDIGAQKTVYNHPLTFSLLENVKLRNE